MGEVVSVYVDWKRDFVRWKEQHPHHGSDWFQNFADNSEILSRQVVRDDVEHRLWSLFFIWILIFCIEKRVLAAKLIKFLMMALSSGLTQCPELIWPDLTWLGVFEKRVDDFQGKNWCFFLLFRPLWIWDRNGTMPGGCPCRMDVIVLLRAWAGRWLSGHFGQMWVCWNNGKHLGYRGWWELVEP